METTNHLENLDLEYELDSAYGHYPEQAEHDVNVGQETIILSGSTEGMLDNCHYIYVDPEYSGALSPGQRQLYELLLSLQQSAIYTVTTVEKLTLSLNCVWCLAIGKRLENLQSLAAISGLKR